jgi:hypothetical protein
MLDDVTGILDIIADAEMTHNLMSLEFSSAFYRM